MRPYLEKLRSLRAADDEERGRLSRLRDELAKRRGELRARRMRLGEARAELRRLKSIKETPEEIRKKIDDIDWRIQTQPLPREEERRLSGILDELHKRLALAERKAQLEEEVKVLEGEVAVIAEEIQKLRNEIGEVKGRLSAIFEQKKALREKIQELKAKSDEWHAKYREAKERLMRLEAERILISSRAAELHERLERLKRDEEARQLMRARERLKAEALSKLSSGKKLTFEEFKALLEDEEMLERLIGRG